MKLLELGTEMSQLYAMNNGFTETLLRGRGYDPGAPPSSTFERVWTAVKPFTLLDRFRARMIFDAVERSLDLPGDCIECGSSAGGISMLIAMILREHQAEKVIFICDSFEGLPNPNRQHDRGYAAGQFAADVDDLRAELQVRGLASYCRIKKGWFEQTLVEFPPDQQFCFAHVDCDLYEPASFCLRALYPKLLPSSRLVLDDYYDTSRGIRTALHEWTQHTRDIIFVGPAPQASIIKSVTVENSDHVTTEIDTEHGPVHVSFDWVRGFEEYSAFLTALDAYHSVRVRGFHRFVARCTGRSSKTTTTSTAP